MKEEDEKGAVPDPFKAKIIDFISTINEQLTIILNHFGPETENDVDKLWKSYEKMREADIFSLTTEVYSELEDERFGVETGIEFARVMMWAEQINFKVGNILKILAKNPIEIKESN